MWASKCPVTEAGLEAPSPGPWELPPTTNHHASPARLPGHREGQEEEGTGMVRVWGGTPTWVSVWGSCPGGRPGPSRVSRA